MSIAAMGLLMPIVSSAISTAANSLSAPAQAPSPKENVREEFLSYARMSPLERMRASILKNMNLTEDDLNAMSADVRKKVEEKIEALIKQEIEEDLGKKGVLIDIAV